MRELLYKTMFVLSLVSAFAIMLYGASGPSMPFNAQTPKYTNFLNGVQTTPGISSNFTVHLSGVGINAPDSVTGCPSNRWDKCIDDNNFTSGIVTFHGNVSVLLQNGYPVIGGLVQGITFGVSCYQHTLVGGTGLTFNFSLADGTQFISTSRSPVCQFVPLGFPGFLTAIWTISLSPMPIEKFMSATLDIDTIGPLPNNHVNTSLSILQMQFYVQRSITTTCPAGDIACAFIHSFDAVIQPLNNLLAGLWNGFTLFINVFIYFGGWVTFIVFTLANYVSVLVWFYSIPGLPGPIQAFVSVIVTVWIGIIGIETYKAIDPFGG